MKTILFIALQLAASGSDAYFTNRNSYGRKPHEDNPIARPFVQTKASRIAYFSTGAAIKIAIPVIFRKHHHPKLATEFSIAGILDNTAGAAYSATHP